MLYSLNQKKLISESNISSKVTKAENFKFDYIKETLPVYKFNIRNKSKSIKFSINRDDIIVKGSNGVSKFRIENTLWSSKKDKCSKINEDDWKKDRRVDISKSSGGLTSPSEKILDTIANETASELDKAIEEISKNSWSPLTLVDAAYTNPKGAVDMVIEYSLDENWKIATITTAATTYDLSKFQWKVTDVIWKSVKEASEMYFSGSSLTTEAFQKAMKSQIK